VKAVFLDYDTVSGGDLDTSAMARAVGTLELCDWDVARTAERMRDADIVLVNKIELTRELLAGAPRLKLVAIAGTGTNHVDVAAARELGIGVCNVRGYCTASVMQHTWALILTLTRRLREFSRMVAERAWSDKEVDTVLAHPMRELDGHTLGIVGFGELGRAVARGAEAFGMRVVVANRRGGKPQPDRLDLDHLLAVSDIVSLHCPLTEGTRLLIGARELALMKRDAVLINTARAGLIDGAALRDALKAGKLGGAGVDVFAPEPPRDDDPLLDPQIPNLILTPHVAWAAQEARQRCVDEMAANIEDFVRGGRRSRVD
jgi:glycerate dehydrogenase